MGFDYQGKANEENKRRFFGTLTYGMIKQVVPIKQKDLNHLPIKEGERNV